MRLLIVDDQTLIRDGLVTICERLPAVEVVGTADDGEDAVRLAGELSPDVVLMDLRMPRMDGIEATRRIRAQQPNTQVVVLTTYSDDESVLAALAAGALGYLTKDAGRDDISRALTAAGRGQALLDPRVHARIVQLAPRRPPRPRRRRSRCAGSSARSAPRTGGCAGAAGRRAAIAHPKAMITQLWRSPALRPG
jgi:DNA-binding NarL/FixJ family response regulator